MMTGDEGFIIGAIRLVADMMTISGATLEG